MWTPGWWKSSSSSRYVLQQFLLNQGKDESGTVRWRWKLFAFVTIRSLLIAVNTWKLANIVEVSVMETRDSFEETDNVILHVPSLENIIVGISLFFFFMKTDAARVALSNEHIYKYLQDFAIVKSYKKSGASAYRIRTKRRYALWITYKSQFVQFDIFRIQTRNISNVMSLLKFM